MLFLARTMETTASFCTRHSGFREKERKQFVQYTVFFLMCKFHIVIFLKLLLTAESEDPQNTETAEEPVFAQHPYWIQHLSNR